MNEREKDYQTSNSHRARVTSSENPLGQMLGSNHRDGFPLASSSSSSSSSITPKPAFAVTPPTPILFDVEAYLGWLEPTAPSFFEPSPSPDNNANTNPNPSPATRRTRKRNNDNRTPPPPPLLSPPSASFHQSAWKHSEREIPRSDTAGNGKRPGAMSVHSQAHSSHDDSKSRFATSAHFPDIPKILPHEKVFPIQIGGELFRLSGASISSDAPSYFSQFFVQQITNLEEGQNLRTLYIDRDPITFRDIARHLQGYHVSPKDGQHFVRLFADAQFYSLPKLISQLFESEIFISIGSRPFRINRDLFNAPGNSPNYFSLGFAVFFSSPNEVFPGLSREGLLRPPSILPPEVPGRSADVFAELLHLLRGYPVHIRNEEHRQELLRDCKYFHLKGLEQKLIPHEISWNQKRYRQEIVIRLEDIKPSGIAFVADGGNTERFSGKPNGGWISYARPFVDDTQRELIIEIGDEQTKVDWRGGRAEFSGTTNQRVSALFQVIANKLGLPIGNERALGLILMGQSGINGSVGPPSPGNPTLSEDRIKIKIGTDCYVKLDGEEWWDREGVHSREHESLDAENPFGSDAGRSAGGAQSPALQWRAHCSTTSGPPSTRPFTSVQGQTGSRKRQKRSGSIDQVGEWIVRSGQWRLRAQTTHGIDGRGGLEVVLVGVKLDAFSGEYGRNSQKGFLT